MRAVTPTFLDTVRGAHRAVFRARILDPGLTGTNPGPANADGSPVNELALLNGDVTFDTGADVNGTLDMQVSLDWPYNTTDLGAPYGQEVFVERGVRYGNGTREYVGLGYFRIDAVEQTDSPKGSLRITGSDRMAAVRDARPIQPKQYTAGTSVGAVIDEVIGAAVPSLVTVYDFSAYTTLLQSDHVLDESRVAFVQEILTAYGKIGYFDYQGRYIVRDNPSLTNLVSWDIDVGRFGVLVSMRRDIRREGIYNAVVATGEPVGDQPPVRGAAFDLNPLSPTYYNGSFGKVPRFFSSSFLTTQAQCETSAASLLVSSTGLPYAVDLGLVPNPALEGWDLVRVNYSTDHGPELHITDRITYPLTVEDTMTLSTRKKI